MGYVAKITLGDINLVGSSLYGVCETSASAAAKNVTLTDFDALMDGVTIHVKFTNGNTAANPTLNVNNTGAVPIYRHGTIPPGTSGVDTWAANAMIALTYDGSAWRVDEPFNLVKQNIVDMIYPVGAIYISRSSVNPATLFGGTWSQIKGKFLIGRDGTHTTEGGSETHTLTASEMPQHRHTIAHTHTISHTHNVAAAVKSSETHSHTYIRTSGTTVGATTATATIDEAKSQTITSGVPSSMNSGDASPSASGYAGSSTAFSIMPPYLPVYMWERTS